MSTLKVAGNPAGGGDVTIQGPASTVTRTLTLPDVDGTVNGWNESPLITLTGTLVDVLGIPATAREIFVMLSGASTNGNQPIGLQLIGSALENAGYAGVGTYASNATVPQVSTIASCIPIGAAIIGSSGSNVILSGFIHLVRMTGNKWLWSGNSARTDAGLQPWLTAGEKSLAASLSGIRITQLGADNFDAGTALVRWRV